jgi:hypothetical protein
MFLRYYVTIARPFQQVEPEFVAGARYWLPSMAEHANEHGHKLMSELGFDIGKRRIGKRIEVKLGDPRRAEGVTLLPVYWQGNPGRAVSGSRRTIGDRPPWSDDNPSWSERNLRSPAGVGRQDRRSCVVAPGG